MIWQHTPSAGNFEKLKPQQQLKCLEEEHKQLKEFGMMDKADEVQALHGWLAREIVRKQPKKKQATASGPAAEFGAGGVKALPQVSATCAQYIRSVRR